MTIWFLLLLTGCSYRVGRGEVRSPLLFRGVVVDPAGFSVPGVPVTLLISPEPLQRGLSAGECRNLRGGFTRRISGVTNSRGEYEFFLIPREEERFFYVAVAGGESSPPFPYGPVPPLEFSDAVRQGGVAIRDVPLSFHPRWLEIEEILRAYGGRSDVAEILWARGLPDERQRFPEGGGKGTEVWWYYPKGMSYRFVDGKLTGQSAFPPVGPLKRGGSSCEE